MPVENGRIVLCLRIHQGDLDAACAIDHASDVGDDAGDEAGRIGERAGVGKGEGERRLGGGVVQFDQRRIARLRRPVAGQVHGPQAEGIDTGGVGEGAIVLVKVG